MEKLEYGVNKQLKFRDLKEKFKTIGYLSNEEHNHNIVFEYKKEYRSRYESYRIRLKKTFNKDILPGLNNALCSYKRVTCNEFVKELIGKFGFILNDNKEIVIDKNMIIKNIPEEFINDFNEGFEM